MKHSRLYVISFVVVLMVCVLQTTPVFADTSTGSLSLEGKYDADTIVLTVTKDFNLYSYGAGDDVNFQAFVEIGSYTPSYTVSLSSYNYSQSYYYDKSVAYQYIVSDSKGSTYYDSLKSFDYVTGPYFTVTCIATITVKSNTSTPEDYKALYNAKLNFSPYLSNVSASNSIEYENSIALAEVNEKLDVLMERNASSTLGNGYDILTFGSDAAACFLFNDTTGVSNIADYDVGSLIEISGNYSGKSFNKFMFSNPYSANGKVVIGYQSPGNYLAMWGCVSASPIDFSTLNFVSALYSGDTQVQFVSSKVHVTEEIYNNSTYYYIVYVPFDVSVYFDSVYIFTSSGIAFSPLRSSFILAKDNGTISDLMAYLDKKWESGYTIDSTVTESKDAADTAISDLENQEQQYFNQYDAAYENAGVSNFKLSVLGNEFGFIQNIVEHIWNVMPPKLQYLFYAVLVLGVFALIISASGRIAKRLDKSGKK